MDIKFGERRRAPAVLALVALVFLFVVSALNAAPAGDDMPQPHGHAMPLMPFLHYYIDETLGMDIEEAAAPGMAASYKPLVLDKLPEVEGVTWLRFTISPLAADARPATFLLDMGQSFPGTPVLFSPERNELSGALEWRENKPAQRNILLLPEAGSEAVTCYLRLEGLPGPWFYPMVRTPQDAANNLAGLARTGAILALGVVMFLCFLRGVSENGQWRIWTAVYVGAALTQAMLGMPMIGDKFNLNSLIAVLAPGIALMLFPHVGRHLLDSPNRSKNLDRQLFLLSLPGAVLALVPLIPGWDWLDRWVELWPALTLIFVPTALGAWLRGLGGAKRFLFGSLIPPIFTGLAYAGLEFGFPPNMLASGPLWGVALSALLIAGTRAPGAYEYDEATPVGDDSAPIDLGQPLDHPLDDPNLRLLPPDGGEELEIRVPTPVAPEMKASTPGAEEKDESRETAIRAAADALARESAALGECELPPIARERAEKIIETAGTLGKILSSANLEAVMAGEEESRDEIFNLQRLLRDAHDSVSDRAANSGVSVSWHMPPHLERAYKGPARELLAVLRNLLESSIRAAPRGAVHVSARRADDGPDAGYILFTVTDNGEGAPPERRSGMAFLKAWELAGRRGGYAGLESGKHGATITFSARLTPAKEEKKGARELAPHALLACEDDKMRATIAAMLEDMPCRVSRAANAHEALVSQSVDPAPILIAYGRLALPSAADLAREFARLAKQAGFSKCFVLAITPDDTHWALLKPSGFTHAMTEPIDAEMLRSTVAALDLAANTPDKNDAVDLENGDNLTVAAVEKKSDSSVARDEEEIKSIVEGEFETERAFDAPDWLAEEGVKPDEMEAPETARSTAAQAPEPQTTKAPEPEPVPEPIKAPKSAHASLAPTQVPEKPLGEEAGSVVEWVGEPTPIVREQKEPEKAELENAKSKDDEEEIFLLTDFIVGAGEVGKGEKGARENEAKVENANESDVSRENFTTEPVADAGSDPVIVALVEKLDGAMKQANAALAAGDSVKVAQATRYVANQAELYGLRVLGRMAQCVERAARANNVGALKDLLPELELAVERNRITLIQKK